RICYKQGHKRKQRSKTTAGHHPRQQHGTCPESSTHLEPCAAEGGNRPCVGRHDVRKTARIARPRAVFLLGRSLSTSVWIGRFTLIGYGGKFTQIFYRLDRLDRLPGRSRGAL